MRTSKIALICSLAAVSLSLNSCGASRIETISQARSVEVKLMRNLSTGVTSWIGQQGSNYAEGRSDVDAVRQASLDRIGSVETRDASANALSFFVLMEATRKMDQNTTKRRNQIDAIAGAKTTLDALVDRVKADLKKNSGKEDSEPPVCDPYDQALTNLSVVLNQSQTWVSIAVREPTDVGDLRGLVQDLNYLRTTMDELSSLTELRLQAIQDRENKAISAISSLMKKISDADESIIKEIK